MRQLDRKAIWSFFIWYFPVFALLLSIIAFLLAVAVGYILLSQYVSGHTNGGNYFFEQYFGTLVGAFFFFDILLAAVFSYLWSYLVYNNYRYSIADIGYRQEFGVIWKKYVTIPYDRIQNVDIYRSFVERILGLSTLTIQTAGSSGAPFAEGRLPGLSVNDAELVRDTLMQRVRAES